MKYSWQEIRNRARDFSEQWRDAHYEMGETQGFYIDFFRVFGIDHRRVLRFEEKVQLIQQDKRGRIDGFWPGMLLIEQKSAGRDLAKAKTQAFDYFEGLRDRDLPKYVLLSDFQNFQLIDLAPGGEAHDFKLADLHKHVELFGFMLGVERRHYGDQDVVSIKAAELLGTIHDALEAKNYTGIHLQRLMVRLLFLLFADDTGIFDDKDDFRFLIEENADADGRNIGRLLNELFEVLDTPMDQRVTDMSPQFAKFPYVNGELFRGSVRTPPFDAAMRDDLLECCAFDWGAVSPAIFGSLFQSVMDRAERRKKGAHYTTEPNIMKVIGPLFLDDLRAELDRLKQDRGTQKRAKLLAFQEKLGGLNFIDPACGCGNFLVVTYRELRRFEQEALELVYDTSSPMMLEVEALSQVKLDQFYGIELEEFPAHIAEVAMWMTEHLANIELGRVFGKVFADIPLHDGASIHHGDALEVDWNAVLPAERCFAVMGNPPFIGAKYQSAEQRQRVREIADLGGSGGTLDFVAAWFLKAGEYVNASGPSPSAEGLGWGKPQEDAPLAKSPPPASPLKERGGTAHPIRIGFVATNSITQGEQVAQLWPVLFDRYGLEIAFAHRTFAWGSDARGKAHVHVVIIGLVHRDYEPKEKRLFSYETVNGEASATEHHALTANLFGLQNDLLRHLVVKEESAPLSDAPRLKTGVQMIDNGILTFTDEEKANFLAIEPEAEPWFKAYLGGDEYINGFSRNILYLREITPAALKSLPYVKAKVAELRQYRAKSARKSTQRMAETPTLVGVDERLEAEYLVIPNTSSERRDYIPLGWLGNEVIANQKLRILPKAQRYQFGILTSQMHMDWMRAITGRLESRYMYSVGVVYNTFPWPEASDTQRAEIEKLAQAVLDARDAYPDSSLADLYDPDTMPPDLRRAHKALDTAVDRLYRSKPFDSDRERVEHLFGLYEKLVNPLSDAEIQNKRTARNRKRKAGK